MAKERNRNYAEDQQSAQTPGKGKVENDHNKPKAGETPSQRNEARRTPHSRHDREAQLGSGNQVQSRRGTKR